MTEPKFSVDTTFFPYSPNYLDLKNGGRIHYVDEGNNQWGRAEK